MEFRVNHFDNIFVVFDFSKMKVIFVASGNKAVGSVSAFVQSQFDSLKEEGLEMVLFPVVGHGVKSYLKAAWKLRKLVKKEQPDIVHAHYSICGYVATMATLFLKPKAVVSILGSFPRKTRKLRIVKFFVNHLWDKTIVKSQRTANQMGMALPVIPNGVNLEQFVLIEQNEARKMVGFEADKKYVVWCSNPERTEKRFGLAQKAVALLKDESVVLFPVFNRTHDDVVKFMCAADVQLMTSVMEGSPNVIKEAMACNCPIVTTDVGDVRWVTDGVEGTFVADDDKPETIARLIKQALDFNARTKGRERIIQEGLTTELIAEKIITIYKDVVICQN